MDGRKPAFLTAGTIVLLLRKGLQKIKDAESP